MEGGKGMMVKRRRRTAIAVAATVVIGLGVPAIAVAANLGATPDSGAANTGQAPAPAGYTGINDPRLIACMQARQVCNPAAASSEPGPLGAPVKGTGAVSSAAAAVALVRASLGAASTSKGGAIEMSGTAAEQLTGQLRSASIDESRPVWVVTIQTPTMTDGSPGRAPEKKDSYSEIVDATTGLGTEDCVGCSWVPVS